MTAGDAAAAAGMDVVPIMADLRESYAEINKTRDYQAAHQTSGTHPQTAIVGLPGALSDLTSALAGKASTSTALAAFAGNLPEARVEGTWTKSVATVGSAQFIATRSTALTSGYIVMYMNSNGVFGYVSSTRESKNHIADLLVSLDDFMSVSPVVFAYKDDEGQAPRLGFYAEDLDHVFPELVAHEDGAPVALHHEAIPAVLWSVVQQQQEQLELLTARVALLEGSAE